MAADDFVRIPATAIESEYLWRNEARFSAFVRLCGEAAPSRRVADVRGVPAMLERGQLVVTRDSLALTFRTTRDVARRHLECFEREGLVSLADASSAAVDGQPSPTGRLVTILGLSPGARPVGDG